MQKHYEKIQQFDHFIMQRALKLFGRDKDRKGYLILFKEHKERLLTRLEAIKASLRLEDKETLPASLYKAVFGEVNLAIEDGLYMDFLHSFDDPTASTVSLYDYGLIELLTTEIISSQTGGPIQCKIEITVAKSPPTKHTDEEQLLEILSS